MTLHLDNTVPLKL